MINLRFKTCKKCGEAKIANTENFFKSVSCNDGLEGRCKVCRLKIMNARNEARRAKLNNFSTPRIMDIQVPRKIAPERISYRYAGKQAAAGLTTPPPMSPERPTLNDWYFYVSSSAWVKSKQWADDNLDRFHLDLGNVFLDFGTAKTKADRLKAAFKNL